MALLLVLGFLGIAIIYPQQKESYTSIIESKELVSDTQRALDENGFIVNLLDRNSLSDADKMAALYSMLKSTLSATMDMNISLKKFNSSEDNSACLLTRSFEACFPDSTTFPDWGSPVPDDREVVGNTFFLVKKSSPGQCLPGPAFKGKEHKTPLWAFFDGPIAYFAEGDLNITLSTTVTPATEVACDQDITVDLSATIPSLGRRPADVFLVEDRSGATTQRKPADIMLVDDRSGSMSWDGILDTLSDPQDIFVSGNYAYVADGSSGLRVINATAPNAPVLAGTYNSPGTAYGV
ncbi:MAG: hypothetical protein V1493_02395, partial [Candidatus Diapherotrites archaeon]